MAGKSPGQQPMNQQPQMGYGEAKFIVQEAEAQLATLMEDDEWFSNKLLRVVRTMFPSDVVPETVTVIRQNEINGTLNSV